MARAPVQRAVICPTRLFLRVWLRPRAQSPRPRRVIRGQIASLGPNKRVQPLIARIALIRQKNDLLWTLVVSSPICTTMPQNVAFLSTFSGVSVRNSFGAWDLRVRIPFGFRVWLRPRAERPRPRWVNLCQSVDRFLSPPHRCNACIRGRLLFVRSRKD